MKLTKATKQIDLPFMRTLQKIYLHDNIFKSIDESFANNDNRLTVVPAGTNAGKSTVITKITIPTIIQRYPHVSCIVFTSPDSGCVDGPFAKFHAEWNGKFVLCDDGSVKMIRARRKDEIKASWKCNEFTPYNIVDVWFVTTQWLGSIWGDYKDSELDEKSIGAPDFVLADEIQFGLGTINAETIFEDLGRENKNFDPKWLPTLYGMAQAGSHVIGYTGTPTKSQLGKTTLGPTVFKTLSAMPENKNTSVFADIMPIRTEIESSTYRSTLLNTYDLSKLVYELKIEKCEKLMNAIESDTWQQAMTIGIVPMLPGAFFKFGRKDASKSIPLYTSRGRKNDLAQFGKDMKADMGFVTTDEKTYTKNGHRTKYLSSALDVICGANDPKNMLDPLLLGVIMQGNMGWDIPRIKQISFLGYPSAKNVFLMQMQTMSRAKRLLCGVYDHTDKAREIAELNISNEQKIALAKFVVCLNTVDIVIPRHDMLLQNAYSEFRENMHTPQEGLDLYLNIIASHVPVEKKNNVTKPHFHMGYNPGSQNQMNKKDYCEHCTDLGLLNDKGETWCKVLGRVQANDLAKRKLSDDDFNHYWKGQLKLDHLNGVRTDNRPENLYTRCGISDGLKTLIAEDYLNKYDSTSKKANGK
jgi:hypothetical protein